MKRKITTKIALIAATLVVVIFSSLLFSACDKTETSGEYEYGMYIRRLSYDPDNHELTIFAGITNNDNLKVEGTVANWHYVKKQENAFYNAYNYEVNFAPATIFSVLKDTLTQEQLNVDGIEYDVLKLVFEYATIYKSLKGGEYIGKSDGVYLHDYDLDETSLDYTAYMTYRTQNSATWYGVLISAAVVLLGVIIGVIFARRKYYACKERTEN